MALSVEADVDALVTQASLVHAVAHTHGRHEIDSALLEHARPHPVDDVIAAAVLDDHRVDAIAVQELREQQPGRTRTDNADLCPMTICH